MSAYDAPAVQGEEAPPNKSCPLPVACCGNKLMLLEVDDATGFQLVSPMLLCQSSFVFVSYCTIMDYNSSQNIEYNPFTAHLF